MITGLQIQYSVNGQAGDESVLQRMTVAMERFGDELRDFGKHVFPKMVPVFEAEIAGQFDAEGRGPNRGGWASLTPRYEAWKSVHYPGRRILEREGALREALTQSDSSHARREYTGTELEYGTTGLPYASAHQSGTSRMVDRPPFDFTVGFEQDITRAAWDGAREALAESHADEFFTPSGEA